MTKRNLFASIALIGSVFFGAGYAHAQTASDISVTLSPETPGPRQDVTITLTSFSTNLQSADIEWSIDGGSPIGGIGVTKYSLTTKAAGVSTSIAVTINPVRSAQVKKYITINPMSVDLLWEAVDSTVPPLYRGKAMPTSESSLKFVAIPNVQSGSGSLLPASSLIYDWQENYTNDQSSSGFGENSYTTDMDYLNPAKHVAVNVSPRDAGVAASSYADVTPVDPKIVWYASSPLYGPIFDMALSGSYSVNGTDTSLYVEPYFFSPGDATSKELEYTWSINGQDIATPATPNSIFLQKDQSTTGRANIDVTILNTTKLFQEISSSLSLYLN